MKKTALKIILLIAAVVVAVFFIVKRAKQTGTEIFVQSENSPTQELKEDNSRQVLDDFLQSLKAGDIETASRMTDSYIQTEPVFTGDIGKLAAGAFAYEVLEEQEKGDNGITYNVKFTWLDCGEMFSGFSDEVNYNLSLAVGSASSSKEIYNGELEYLPEVLAVSIDNAYQTIAGNYAEHCVCETVKIAVIKDGDGHAVEMNEGLYNILSNGRAYAEESGGSGYASLSGLEEYYELLTDKAKESAEYIPFHYSLDEGALYGPVPNADGFGSAADSAEIEQLLAGAYAKQLTEGKNLVWSPELNMIEDSEIRYYLDETILALVWNEPIERTWGTFCEIIISDPSQFRRKIVNDTFNCDTYKYPYELAEETNAVIASTADLYDHWSREIGICVYQGHVLRYDTTGDVCFVTKNGDLIMRSARSFDGIEDARKFVEENEISFSMCFGPTTIQNGENVTPQYYTYGEIYDDYPRIMISQIDELHYLIVTSNQNPDRLEFGAWGCSLDVITQAMFDHGCTNAYTLDGGQTGAVMMNGEMVNPEQYRGQQIVSDIIYFATAIPEE